MATDVTIPPARFEIGRVITRMFEVIGSNAVTFFALAALASIPSLLFSYIGTQGAAISVQMKHAALSPAALSAVIGGAVIGFLIYTVFVYLLQAALVHGTISTLNGEKASFMDCLTTGVRHALPLTAIVFLAVIGIGFGFLLLIVPGVILALMWSVLTPVRVAERTGILQTFSRSAELTRGHRGAIFGLFVIFFVVALVLSLFIPLLTGLSFVPAAGMHFTTVYLVVSGLVRIVTSLVGATGVASIYYELRVVKEGVGPEQLAAVFA